MKKVILFLSQGRAYYFSSLIVSDVATQSQMGNKLFSATYILCIKKLAIERSKDRIFPIQKFLNQSQVVEYQITCKSYLAAPIALTHHNNMYHGTQVRIHWSTKKALNSYTRETNLYFYVVLFGFLILFLIFDNINIEEL